MPVEMKKEIRKRVACHIGATLEDMRKAESECDGELFLYPVDTKGTLGGFYILHVPAKGKIAQRFSRLATSSNRRRTRNETSLKNRTDGLLHQKPDRENDL